MAWLEYWAGLWSLFAYRIPQGYGMSLEPNPILWVRVPFAPNFLGHSMISISTTAKANYKLLQEMDRDAIRQFAEQLRDAFGTIRIVGVRNKSHDGGQGLEPVRKGAG